MCVHTGFGVAYKDSETICEMCHPRSWLDFKINEIEFYHGEIADRQAIDLQNFPEQNSWADITMGDSATGEGSVLPWARVVCWAVLPFGQRHMYLHFKSKCIGIGSSRLWTDSVSLYLPVSKYSCIDWVHSRPARRINNGFQAVGTYIYSKTVILPGKSLEHASTTCFYWESAEHCLSGGEYLQVGEHCSTAWVPYTAGNPLEFGAVQGGSLPDGTSLYVVNPDINAMWGASRWAYGYYRPDTELAYAGNRGPQTKIQMQMLLVV